jgi:hypothetical protein
MYNGTERSSGGIEYGLSSQASIVSFHESKAHSFPETEMCFRKLICLA